MYKLKYIGTQVHNHDNQIMISNRDNSLHSEQTLSLSLESRMETRNVTTNLILKEQRAKSKEQRAKSKETNVAMKDVSEKIEERLSNHFQDEVLVLTVETPGHVFFEAFEGALTLGALPPNNPQTTLKQPKQKFQPSTAATPVIVIATTTVKVTVPTVAAETTAEKKSTGVR